MRRAISPLPNTPSWRGTQLKHRDNFTFTFYMSSTALFSDIEKAFDTTWHPGLLYKLYQLHVSASLIRLLSSLLSDRTFRLSVENECQRT
jgi:hypothetical protein